MYIAVTELLYIEFYIFNIKSVSLLDFDNYPYNMCKNMCFKINYRSE